jgi:hypothetical protein
MAAIPRCSEVFVLSDWVVLHASALLASASLSSISSMTSSNDWSDMLKSAVQLKRQGEKNNNLLSTYQTVQSRQSFVM